MFVKEFDPQIDTTAPIPGIWCSDLSLEIGCVTEIWLAVLINAAETSA